MVEVSKCPLKENFRSPVQLIDDWSGALKVQEGMFSQQILASSTVKSKVGLLSFTPSRL